MIQRREIGVFSVLCDHDVSREALAAALGVPLQPGIGWKLRQADPTIFRLSTPIKDISLRDDEVDLELRHAPSVAERIADLF
jgi:hypothetical protein